MRKGYGSLCVCVCVCVCACLSVYLSVTMLAATCLVFMSKISVLGFFVAFSRFSTCGFKFAENALFAGPYYRMIALPVFYPFSKLK